MISTQYHLITCLMVDFPHLGCDLMEYYFLEGIADLTLVNELNKLNMNFHMNSFIEYSNNLKSGSK